VRVVDAAVDAVANAAAGGDGVKMEREREEQEQDDHYPNNRRRADARRQKNAGVCEEDYPDGVAALALYPALFLVLFPALSLVPVPFPAQARVAAQVDNTRGETIHVDANDGGRGHWPS